MNNNIVLKEESWLRVLEEEMNKDYFRRLINFVEDEYEQGVVYPIKENVYKALECTPLDNVKVVILGQDPYHNVNQAHGLSFSVLKTQDKLPPSLKNIYKEIEDDIGIKAPTHGYLEKWARQGVLLLNTVLTVREHEANSHKNKGWEKFTDSIIRILNKQDKPIVYMLWGGPAQKKEVLLNNTKHLILKAPHPSPLSAYRGFFGCKHFSIANSYLKDNAIEPIDWDLE